jgi:DNA-binding FadR family transcriptional regulator
MRKNAKCRTGGASLPLASRKLGTCAQYADVEAVVKADLGLGTRMDELRRISACMIGAVAPASLAHEAVLDMEMDLLRQGWPVGQSLGALPEVQKRLGLGRPASREAVTILEARGLLDVRRGPGGGLFVAAPALEDVAGAVLMYLALTGKTQASIEEFQLLVWRVIVSAAIQRRVSPLPDSADAGQWGFAVDLAEQVGNTTIGFLARLAEMLMRISHGGESRACDRTLEAAIRQGDLIRAFERLDDLIGSVNQDAPVVALEAPERGFSLSGRKSAMALAARMARELSERPGVQEAEWETADRLGYTDAVVRQARRILQDFGIIRCRQGRKGAELAPPAAPTGVIRLLAACLVASAASTLEIEEAISYLVSAAPVLAARRVKAAGSALVRVRASASGPDGFEALTLENHLLELSGNPLLAIVVPSLGHANIFIASGPLIPPHCSDVMAINRRILKAIEAGDVGAAGVLARVKLEVMQRPADGYLAVA